MQGRRWLRGGVLVDSHDCTCTSMASPSQQPQSQAEAMNGSPLPQDPPPRVVGFKGRRSFSSNDLAPAGGLPVVTCSLSLPRQPSEGSLKRLFGGGAGAAPRPLAPVATRRRAPPRLQSIILLAGNGQHDRPVTPVAVALPGAEAGGCFQISGLRRTGSMPLDITPRWVAPGAPSSGPGCRANRQCLPGATTLHGVSGC